jgi:pectin methylesterase-like acyl-CoA thioesterase
MVIPTTTSSIISYRIIDVNNIIYVDGGEADFTTIQDAIDTANEGDTIYVEKGIYCENIIINKSLILIGEDKEYTIIDGMYTG